ncbi:MAG TPA: hypothetical protein VF173_06320 [Thermoanaerobaculia bacterium]|nr:hypothetical protein [Thermoanaerobaculia bacterium]
MFVSRLHLALGLSALLFLAASFPGAPAPAAVRVVFEMATFGGLQPVDTNAARPEPIEVEPDGLAVSGGARNPGK